MVHDLDSPQIFDLINSFEAGNHEPQGKALLRAQRLAVHAIAHHTVVHRLGERNAGGALHFFRAFRDDPGRPVLHARLLEQQGQRHAGPFGAASQAVGFLNGFVRRRARFPRHSMK